MESLAPEKAGLDNELLSKRKMESALEVESARLKESRLTAVESRTKDCRDDESGRAATEVSGTISAAAAFLKLLLLLTS